MVSCSPLQGGGYQLTILHTLQVANDGHRSNAPKQPPVERRVTPARGLLSVPCRQRAQLGTAFTRSPIA